MATKQCFQKCQPKKPANLDSNWRDVTVSTVAHDNGVGEGGCVSHSLSLPFGVLGGEKKRGKERPLTKNEVVEISKAKASVNKIKEIGIKACPQCRVEFDGVSCSPIQDACGHIRCRVCFIQSLGKGDNYCQQCELNNGRETEFERTVKNVQLKQRKKSIVKAADRPKQLIPVIINANCGRASKNIAKKRLKVALQSQSMHEQGNVARASVKSPTPKQDKRGLHSINYPDHVFRIQSNQA